MRTFLVALLWGSLGLAGALRAETLYFIHVDHLGTPRLAIGEDGVERWRWDQLEPFGDNVPIETMGTEGYPINLPLRFPGQYADKETGLHYNYFRDYDPSIGRYGESDPIGLQGGLNTYAYVESSPLRDSDLLGLQIAPPGGASGGLIGGGAAGGSAVGAAGGGSGSSNAIAKGLHNLIKEFQKPCCPECEPPVGTKCFRQNFGHGHGPFPPGQSHFHLYVMEQIPYPSCQCTWKQQGGTRGTLDFAPYFFLDCELIPSWIVQHGGA